MNLTATGREQIRNNNTISRDQLIDPLVIAATEMCPANTVDLDEPKFILNVDVVRKVCCLGVLCGDRTRYRKYNLESIQTAADVGVKKADECGEIAKEDREVKAKEIVKGDAGKQDGLEEAGDTSDNAAVQGEGGCNLRAKKCEEKVELIEKKEYSSADDNKIKEKTINVEIKQGEGLGNNEKNVDTKDI